WASGQRWRWTAAWGGRKPGSLVCSTTARAEKSESRPRSKPEKNALGGFGWLVLETGLEPALPIREPGPQPGASAGGPEGTGRAFTLQRTLGIELQLPLALGEMAPAGPPHSPQVYQKCTKPRSPGTGLLRAPAQAAGEPGARMPPRGGPVAEARVCGGPPVAAGGAQVGCRPATGAAGRDCGGAPGTARRDP